MECLETTTYSLVINGVALPSFVARRGLRQGDPVSPLLFVWVMEYFMQLMKNAARNPCFRYHPGCRSLDLSCLAFADDVLVFSKVNAESVRLITEVLTTYEEASGLSANLQKSRLYAWGVPRALLQQLLNIQVSNLGSSP